VAQPQPYERRGALKSILRLGAAGLLLAALLGGLLSPVSAWAQVPNLAGSYHLDDPAAMQKIRKAVDKVTDRMGFLIASIAHDRLMDANQPAQQIVISMAGNKVTVQFDQDQPITGPADGSTIDWTRDNGEKVKVTTVWQGATLQRAVASEQATRTVRFTLDGTGQILTVDIQIVSSRLPVPLTYQLTYRRNG
jgi:hypothetical protein